MKFKLPDYNNCCVNLISSIAKHYNIDTQHPSLLQVDQRLTKNPRNIVVLLLDGFGKELLCRHCQKDGFFAKHFVQDLSAVFPSSTTPSTVSFKSGYTPLEHGWWAHFLYFKEVGATVNLYLNTDAYSHAPTKLSHIAHDLMPYSTIMDRICDQHKQQVRCYALCPPDCRDEAGITQITYDTYDEMTQYVSTVCQSDGQHYIYAYYNLPDSAEHKFGPYSKEAGEVLAEIEVLTKLMCQKCPDTLFLISADHGQTPVREVRDISTYPDLYECLSMAPSGGTRTMNVFVKSGMHAKFKKLAQKYLGDKFLILSRKQVLNMGLLGKGKLHPKVDDTLGDFLIVAVADCGVHSSTLFRLPITLPLGGHGGLTPEEMTVPLFIYENENKN